MTVHLVYVRGTAQKTPEAIANEVTAYLSPTYDVRVYNWNDTLTIIPEAGDILIGLPHHERRTIFRNSFWHPNWKKRIILSPIHHAMPWYNAFLDPYVEHTDGFLAICGKYWIDTWQNSLFAHWWPWITHVDLAVNQQHFAPLEREINPQGQRKFLYIGHTADYKGCDYLSQLADANPNLQIGWIGGGTITSTRIKRHGHQDLSTSAGRQIVTEYDYLLTCGRSDANPTTILEAGSWGLVPVCTPQSGYYDEDWLVNIPLYCVAKSSAILNGLNSCSVSQIKTWQKNTKQVLDKHYNWERFCRQVQQSIEAPPAPKMSYNNQDVKCFLDRRHLKRMDVEFLKIRRGEAGNSMGVRARRVLSAVKCRLPSNIASLEETS